MKHRKNDISNSDKMVFKTKTNLKIFIKISYDFTKH